MSKCNAVLISLVCFIVVACSAPASPTTSQSQGPDVSADVYYRDFDTTSIVNLDAKALKGANDMSYSLVGESAKVMNAKLHSLGCQVDRSQMAQDLRLLVVYRSKSKNEEWQFSKFFYVTPSGQRCQLNDAQRQLLDRLVRAHHPARVGKE